METKLLIKHRTCFGDIEIDTIVGKNHLRSLLSIVDRKTGYIWLGKCHSRKAEDIRKTTICLLHRIKEQLKMTTTDNGKEFSLHEYITEELKIDWYFANLYYSAL